MGELAVGGRRRRSTWPACPASTPACGPGRSGCRSPRSGWCWPCPPAAWPELVELAGRWSVEATAIGRLTGDGRLRVAPRRPSTSSTCPWPSSTAAAPVASSTAEWTDPPAGHRRRSRPARPTAPTGRRPRASTTSCSSLLADPTVASKEAIIRTYDHEVRGGSLVRPWCGPAGDGPSDGSRLRAARPLGRRAGLRAGRGHQPPLRAPRPLPHGGLGRRRGVPQPRGGGRRPRPGGAARQLLLGQPDPARPARRAGAGVGGLPRRGGRLPGPVRLGQGQPVQRVRGRADPRHAAHHRAGPARPPATTPAPRPPPRPARSSTCWARPGRELGGSLAAEHLGRDGGVVPGPVDDPLARYRAVHRAIARRPGRWRPTTPPRVAWRSRWPSSASPAGSASTWTCLPTPRASSTRVEWLGSESQRPAPAGRDAADESELRGRAGRRSPCGGWGRPRAPAGCGSATPGARRRPAPRRPGGRLARPPVRSRRPR